METYVIVTTNTETGERTFLKGIKKSIPKYLNTEHEYSTRRYAEQLCAKAQRYWKRLGKESIMVTTIETREGNSECEVELHINWPGSILPEIRYFENAEKANEYVEQYCIENYEIKEVELEEEEDEE